MTLLSKVYNHDIPVLISHTGRRKRLQSSQTFAQQRHLYKYLIYKPFRGENGKKKNSVHEEKLETGAGFALCSVSG